MILFISLLMGSILAYIIYLSVQDGKTFLQKKLRMKGKKQKSSIKVILDNLSELLKPLSARSTQNTETKAKNKLMLIQAGLPSSEEDIIELENKKLINLLMMGALGTLILIIKLNYYTVLIFLGLLYAGYIFPQLKVRRIINMRKRDLNKHLADALDMLAICVEAGLSLDGAIDRVGTEFAHLSPTIHQEFKRLSRDISQGTARQDAFHAMSVRLDNKELKSFIALLIQTDKLGTSISGSLRIYCDSVRTRKRQAIEELSQNVSSKMTIPMILFMLPAMFIVILFPAAIKIMEATGG